MKSIQTNAPSFTQPLQANQQTRPLFGEAGRYIVFEPKTKKGAVSQLMETLFSGNETTSSDALDFYA